ncbi:MAG: hypothetical protein AAF488_16550, partial [Planctomycetota bacterium]
MRSRSKLGAVLALPIGLAIIVLVWVFQPPSDSNSDLGLHPGVAPWEELGSAARDKSESIETTSDSPTTSSPDEIAEVDNELATLS